MIIAIKEKNKVVIGYSNTDVWGKLCNEDYIDKENVAIKFFENGTMFACNKMSRCSDILLYSDELMHKAINPNGIIRQIIPFIKRKLRENDINLDEDGSWDNALVICDKERLYDIDTMFGFYEVEDYVCHGFCVKTLKSILEETTMLPAEERIMKAVCFASEFHKESLFPLIITDTESKKFKYIYERGKSYEYIDCI